MSSQRLARQAYTKRWKRARREVKRITAAVRAELRAEQEARDAARAEQAVQEAAWLHRHQEQLQLAEEIAEEFMAVPTCSEETWKCDDMEMWKCSFSTSDDDSAPPAAKQPRTVGMSGNPVDDATPTTRKPCQQSSLPTPLPPVTHGGEEWALVVATIERIMEKHIGRLMRRIDALEDTVRALISRTHSPPPPLLQEDLLLAPCRTLSELEELDRSLAQQDQRNKMQHFLGTFGGASAGDAIRRILQRVATNDVLSQYSLKGRRAKKSFQELVLCQVIMAACLKNFPGQTEAKVEECIAQALKFAPHRRSTGQQN